LHEDDDPPVDIELPVYVYLFLWMMNCPMNDDLPVDDELPVLRKYSGAFFAQGS